MKIVFMRLIMLNPFVSLFHAMDWIGLTVCGYLVGESDEYLCRDDCDSLGMYGNYACA